MTINIEKESAGTLSRIAEIAELLKRDRRVRVADLSKRLETSEVTIRRDLSILEQQGLLYRTYGGAVLRESVKLELNYNERLSEHSEEKLRIGKKACSLIKDGDVIILDAGTTNLEIARHLRTLGKSNISVLTSGLAIAQELLRAGGITVMLVGGVCRSGMFELVGPMVAKSIQGLHVDKMFIGADGVCVENGLTTPDMAVAETGKQLAQIAKKVVLVADASKFGKTYFAQCLPISQIDTLITDDALPQETRRELTDAGVELLIA